MKTVVGSCIGFFYVLTHNKYIPFRKRQVRELCDDRLLDLLIYFIIVLFYMK
jgi:hypothetical protein